MHNLLHWKQRSQSIVSKVRGKGKESVVEMAGTILLVVHIACMSESDHSTTKYENDVHNWWCRVLCLARPLIDEFSRTFS